jgi:tetratricopeptide (TPR) repeat protein
MLVRVFVFSVFINYLSAQQTDPACEELRRTVLVQASSGRSNEAEALLSAASVHGKRACAGFALTSLAAAASATGRITEAEAYAERSLKILEMDYGPNDPILLLPLQILMAMSFEQQELAKSRRIFQRMLQIPAGGPYESSLLHATAATLLQYEGKLEDAENELIAAIRAWEETGHVGSADYGSLFYRLATLYIEQGRYAEARTALESASVITEAAKDATPMDRFKLLEMEGVLHARNHEWLEAGQKLHQALAMAERETHADPMLLRSILANYAAVLRKMHRRREARSLEDRAAALPRDPTATGLVDVAELLRESNPTLH